MTEIKLYIESELNKRYETVEIDGNNCFLVSDNTVVRIGKLNNAIVVEYADSIKDAEKNYFEDGGVFDSELYPGEKMVQAILKEIA